MKDELRKQRDIDALEYHKRERRGKIEVNSTKPCISSDDLSLAYTPGVAAPCLKIADNKDEVYSYTAKGNLVGVISNGTAVLGLGNIGPEASKPVMEGKAVLFKRFADIDVFDIEIDETDVDSMVKIIKALGPTFGGINLEDIKAPECFELERRLVEEMDIPVFHDDQHGTAIIAAAGFVNALGLQEKKIEDVKVVFSGAGAAAMTCARLYFELGVKRENLMMCDSKGVIYKGRTEGMNPYKEEFAIKTECKTLEDAMKGADAFMGLSRRGTVDKKMISSMAKRPIIFAMANPEPEIFPWEVAEVRNDAIMATGRTDFPNQINNVLGFPFIFRGALDTRAKKINMEMKLAAVFAIAELAKKEVSPDVKMAYGNEEFSFGPEYIIPKPFDSRVLTEVAPAVAKAAMDSNVSRIQIDDLAKYRFELGARLGTATTFLSSLRDRLKGHVLRAGKKTRIVYAEGANTRVLNAVSKLLDEDLIEPILLGNKKRIEAKIEELGFSNKFKDVEKIEPENDERFKEFYHEFSKENERKGITLNRAEELMEQESYFAGMFVKKGHADGLLNGPSFTYKECLEPLKKVIGSDHHVSPTGIYMLVFKNRVLFLADCTVNIEPSSEQLADIALATSIFYKKTMKEEPRVAFLSFSNFGSNQHPLTRKVRDAVSIVHRKVPSLKVDGEMQADVAVNEHIMNNLFDFSNLDKEANVLIFPDLTSANIAYKLLSQLADCQAIGPVLLPMKKPVNIIARTAPVNEIINMSIVTALIHHEK